MANRLAFTWQLSEAHGWGLVGVHTALHLAERGRPPLLLAKPAMETLRPENRLRLRGLEQEHDQLAAISAQHGGQVIRTGEVDILHALGNGFLKSGGAAIPFQGRRNVGVIAFEDTRLDDAALARARGYDRVVVHSTYNRDRLLGCGLTDVGLVFQGIDPSEMKPLPPSGAFGDRFVVFSGGKLEFRKAQDVVLAAFRAFHARHPDALLVTAWHNLWPASARTIAESPLVQGAPQTDGEGRLDIHAWAVANGVAADAFVDLGFLGRRAVAAVLADCHAAVFPNRCEGATNLVAMEAMACGVPTILSANTGHLDVIRPGAALPLTRQTPLPDPQGARTGWMESSVEELVEHLEALYTDRAAARAMAGRALDFMQGERTWAAFAAGFVDLCTL
ncbi:MAG TPA: glycosyltransferase family 4 protein [Azospirillum sp.]|nr:glycosyltransferase family 4 protein [Azospirillum sp.]